MFRRMNRFLLFILAGFGIYLAIGILVVAFRWQSLTANPGNLLDSLTTNFISDAVFFVLVGVAGTLAQFYSERGDVLQQRLQRVFANNKVSLPVIDFFEEVARANSVYAVLAEHQVSVLEFRPDLCAYRGEFRNVYRLKNAFGDIPYDATIQVEVARDYTRPGVDVEAVVTGLQLQRGTATESFLQNKARVPAEGFKQPIRVSLSPSGEATLVMSWWSWIDARGDWDSGFSLKRFAERFVVRVENRCPKPIRIARSRDAEDIAIDNGQTFIVVDVERVPPRTRVEFFWRPPEGEACPEDLASGQHNTNVLDFDGRLGDVSVTGL